MEKHYGMSLEEMWRDDSTKDGYPPVKVDRKFAANMKPVEDQPSVETAHQVAPQTHRPVANS